MRARKRLSSVVEEDDVNRREESGCRSAPARGRDANVAVMDRRKQLQPLG